MVRPIYPDDAGPGKKAPMKGGGMVRPPKKAQPAKKAAGAKTPSKKK